MKIEIKDFSFVEKNLSPDQRKLAQERFEKYYVENSLDIEMIPVKDDPHSVDEYLTEIDLNTLK